MPFLAQDAVFKRLSEIAEVASLSKEERRQYDESLRHYRDTIAVMHGQYLEGEAKGRAEGLEEGLKKGRTEGRTEGRAEGIMEVARKMKAKGHSEKEIEELTGLTREEIYKLLPLT